MFLTEWLGEDNELGIDIWKRKYQYNNESFDEWLDRVSGGDEEVKQLIIEKKFLFGGRILANRGLAKNGRKITYSNCYVMTPPEDNLESIFECASKLARTYSYGGGCGIDISKLSPKGAKIHNAAKETTGAVSFMDLYSMVTGLIGQNGRRGALMISLDCSHPDVEEFIKIKTDLDRVTKANISVRISDKFMHAVQDDADYCLYFDREETGEHIEKWVNARELFHLIAKTNWDYAEPGALFWDRIKSWNLLSEDSNFEFAGTNPCLVGDTMIQTTDGVKRIKDLVGTHPDVFCMDETGKLVIRTATKVWKTRNNAPLVQVNHLRGHLVCTPDHLIYTINRGWVAAKDLLPKDRLNGLGVSMMGETHCCYKLTSDKKYHSAHRFILSHYEDITGMDVHHIDGNPLNNIKSNLQALNHGVHSVITNIGHKSYCNQDPITGKWIKRDNKKSRSKLQVNQTNLGKNFIVTSVEFLDYTEDVYDMEIPDVHNFIAENIVVHNCAEEPLPSGGACLLGSINLSEFVNNPFTTKARFDLSEFERVVSIGVWALNDVLDEGLPLHPLQEQQDCVRNWRQIGLGIMGLADCLIKLGITYGSKEAIMFCKTVSNAMINTAVLESTELAYDYGTYPKYNPSAVASSRFYIANITDHVKAAVRDHGLRNSQLLTIAPTGTLSTMLGISGGIEPIYANYYTRKTESLYGEEKYYKVYTPIVKQYMDANDVDDTQLPKYFVTAMDLDYKARINMQAAWQYSVDASISSTVNVPNSFTVEETEDLYKYAWQRGLKGITIFRDGCARLGVLSTSDNSTSETNSKNSDTSNDSTSETDSKNTQLLQRGDVIDVSDNLIGKKRKLTTGCGSLHCIALFDPHTGELRETYLSKGSTGGCNSLLSALSRMISISARGGLTVDTIVDQLNSCLVCPSYAARRATKGDTSKGSCCPMAVGNALMDMYNEMQRDLEENPNISVKSEPVTVEHTSINPVESKVDNLNCICPECGEPLVFEGGCNTCKNCGWSKCL